jgi:modification methylase
MLYFGDCLEVLHNIQTATVDLVVADPPYSINTKSDGAGKLNPWADLVNASYWYKAWIGECRRILKPSGGLWSFLNWRSMVTFQKAGADLNWPIESVLIWDKAYIGPGGQKGLRPSYEMVALWAMPNFSIDDRGIADIKKVKWSSTKPTGHPAEKPEALVKWLIEISTRPGALVVDPFSGSGTTGAVCATIGREFIGAEVDEYWHGYATNRITAAQSQPALFEATE